ncbi:peptidoglycan-binding domain-containing protein [Kitasatospora sp. NPDC049258]|uniref:peptidoglycan-binding domain-containing protein n=1 Tax=Kitasatospora sp. NPDC049258 TaxID=3155394 RepID=UPI003437ADDF
MSELVEERVGSAASGTGGSRMRRRRRVLLAAVLAATVVAGGGLAAASLVKSPAERAADTAPPPDTLLTAPVTRQVLNRSAVTRGQVYPPTQYNVTPVAASTEISQLYVSRTAVRTGDQVANGQLLAEVSGQPLFVLQGPVPAYRDLKPGSSGPDVAELQAALQQLGHGHGDDPDGSFGPGTAEAVTGYYRRLGYPAPTTGAATQQAVDAARRAVEADQQAIDALKAQQAAATTPAATPAAPGGADLGRQLTAARKKVTEDNEALARARAVNGPMVPAGEVVFLPALPASVTAVNATVGSPVQGPLISLTSGQLAVTGRLDPGQAAGIVPGMAVEILSETTGQSVRGSVAELDTPTTTPLAGKVIAIGGGPAPAGAGAAAGGTGGQGGGPGQGGQQAAAYVPLQITPAQPLPAAFSGQNVRITVLRDTSAQPVLSVPVAAVFTDAAGRTAVTRADPAGRRTTVPVTCGTSADGYVGVSADDGTLAEGDQVVVGR